MISGYDNYNLAHYGALGMLPHADDKNGLRTLYPGTGTFRNMMATYWLPPASLRNSNQP